MVFKNPKAHKNTFVVINTFKWILTGILCLALIAEAGMYLIMCHAAFIGAFLATAVLTIVIFLIFKSIVDRLRPEMKINLDNNIAFCDCGHKFSSRNISWQIASNATATTSSSDSGSYTSYTGVISCKVSCPVCGKNHAAAVTNVPLGNDVKSYKSKWYSDTIEYSTSQERTSIEKLKSYVEEKYRNNRESAKSDFERCLKLGYTLDKDILKRLLSSEPSLKLAIKNKDLLNAVDNKSEQQGTKTDTGKNQQFEEGLLKCDTAQYDETDN
ncbi:MAG: hypothetical protein K2N14_04595 [Clostridia bacterium]|nr:hypothetical protein [Clostridia bacterium]